MFGGESDKLKECNIKVRAATCGALWTALHSMLTVTIIMGVASFFPITYRHRFPTFLHHCLSIHLFIKYIHALYPFLVESVFAFSPLQIGRLLSRDSKKCMATVEVVYSSKVLAVDYDNICEYTGDVED